MDNRKIERLAQYFSVLQNSLCLRIIFILKENPMYVYEITNKLKAKQAVVSRALKKLRLINLVGFEQRENRRKYYLKRDDIFELILSFSEKISRKKR